MGEIRMQCTSLEWREEESTYVVERQALSICHIYQRVGRLSMYGWCRSAHSVVH